MIRWLVIVSLLCFGLISCTETTSTQPANFITTRLPDCNESEVPNRFIIHWKNGMTTTRFDESRQAFIKGFMEEHKERILFAEHDHRITLENPIALFSNDTGVDPEDWGQIDAQTEAAWQKGASGEGVLIAVLDSGADIHHPQLSSQLYVNARETINGEDDDGNGYKDDLVGWNYIKNSPTMSGDTFHGTHVAGIALASVEGGRMKGIAPRAKLIPLKFIDRETGYLSDAVKAIDYAVSTAKIEQKPLVINASWGGPDCSKTLKLKMAEFENDRVLFSVAAGNHEKDLINFPVYPAAFGIKSTVVVGAYSARNVLAKFSNFGVLVHLAAPGVDIFSLAAGGDYFRASGTSMAAPFVSGAAALLWSYKPSATTQQIREALIKSVVPQDFDVRSQGKLNMAAALNYLETMKQ